MATRQTESRNPDFMILDIKTNSLDGQQQNKVLNQRSSLQSIESGEKNTNKTGAKMLKERRVGR